jgi:hypothetical protein
MSTYLALKITFSPETSFEGVCPCIHKALKGRYRCSKMGNKSPAVLTDNHGIIVVLEHLRDERKNTGCVCVLSLGGASFSLILA